MKVLSLFDGISTGQFVLNELGISPIIYYASEIESTAISITQHNYPNTIQLGDVTNWKLWDINWSEIELLIGGSPCFVGETLVMTNSGMKQIKDIKVGDYVLTHKQRFRKVLNIGGKISNDLYRLSGGGCSNLKSTGNHPFYVRDMTRKMVKDTGSIKNTRTFGKPYWLECDKITNQMISSTFGIHDENSIYNETFWELIGRYVGDGWYRKSKRQNRKNSYQYAFIICCGNSEFDELDNLFKQTGYNYSYSKERTGYKFKITQQWLVEFCEQIGKGAQNKTFPKELWNQPKSHKHSFLKGYLDSDGCYNEKTKTYTISSVSKTLIYETKLLVMDLYNTYPMISFFKRKPTTTIENRTVNQKDTWSIRWHTDKRLQDKGFIEDSIVWTYLRKHEKLVDYSERVYNLEVEEDNSYTADTIIVHNCQNLSIIQSKNRDGLEGSKSALFYHYADILNFIRLHNPNVKFLLENNYGMPQTDCDIITSLMGVNPIMIDAKHYSCQSRKRLYWTNIDVNLSPQPTQKTLTDIILPPKEIQDKYWYNYDFVINESDTVIASLVVNCHDMGKRVYSETAVCPTLTCVNGGYAHKKVFQDGRCRKLLPLEYERAMTLPDDYTKYGIKNNMTVEISDTGRYNACGNGWVANVIKEIFKGLTHDN